MLKPLFLGVMILLFVGSAQAQTSGSFFEGGFRFSKSIGLYHENGIDLKYRFTKRISIGAYYVSSRFGSSWKSNAIKQDNFLLSVDYNLLSRQERFFLDTGVQTGFFRADYESDVFDVLQNESALFALEFSPGIRFKNVVLESGFGYNVIHGKGISGAGTLYPFYVQTSVRYRF